MNDLRDAIERIGGAFDTPDGGWEDLGRRRKRLRTRHRVAAGALAAIVAGGGTLLTVRAFSGSSPTPSPTVHPATSGAAKTTVCPGPPKDGSPAVTFSSTSGPAGSEVELSGQLQTGERWLQVWWNADEATLPTHLSPPPWPATGPELRFGPASNGPVLKVAAVAGPGPNPDCSFRTTFTVPDVAPGRYQILRVSGMVNPPSQEAYAMLSDTFAFRVTG